MQKRILDACCGGRMFWFNKQNPDVSYIDNRQLTDTLCDGRTLEINPDIVTDFKSLPFDDETFYMVVFDPPHLLNAGDNSWLAKKYGKLKNGWQDDIAQGFKESMRVLKTNGTLIFKWNEDQVPLKDVLKCFSKAPLIGNKRSKTHWLVFMK